MQHAAKKQLLLFSSTQATTSLRVCVCGLPNYQLACLMSTVLVARASLLVVTFTKAWQMHRNQIQTQWVS